MTVGPKPKPDVDLVILLEALFTGFLRSMGPHWAYLGPQPSVTTLPCAIPFHNLNQMVQTRCEE